jgi:hypothetical protein
MQGMLMNPDPVQLRAYARLLELGVASDKATEAAIIALRFQAAMVEAAAEVDGFFSEKH